MPTYFDEFTSNDNLDANTLNAKLQELDTAIANLANGGFNFNQVLFPRSISSLGIKSGSITPTQSYHHVSAESGTTDDLTFITGIDRMLLILEADTNDTITVKHGVSNIYLRDEADFDLGSDNALMLFYNGSQWLEV